MISFMISVVPPKPCRTSDVVADPLRPTSSGSRRSSSHRTMAGFARVLAGVGGLFICT
jgi:hypothetical protein